MIQNTLSINPEIKPILQETINKHPNTPLYWEVFLTEENEIESLNLMEDLDTLINTGSNADVILYKSPKGSLSINNKIGELSEYLLQDFGLHLALINQDLSKIVFVADTKEKPSIIPIDSQILRDLFANNIIKNHMADFETRRPQMLMIKTIIDSLNNSTHAFIEASTGTGKSLAYLLPSALFAYTNNTKVVISTFTKNLQQQLNDKDIPLVIALLNLPIEYSLIKGKGNYLCLKRFNEFLTWEKQSLELYDIAEEKENEEGNLVAITDWLKKTKTGDLEELPYEVIKGIWDDVNTTSDLCTHKKCPYFIECFYYKIKNNYQKSHLIIINHSLLIAQLELDFNDIPHSLIPDFDHLIIDEAHNFAKSALIEEQTSFLGLLGKVNKLYSPGKSKKGLFNFLLALFNQKKFAENQTEVVEIINNSIPLNTESLKQKLGSFFTALYSLVEKNLSPYDTTLRVTSDNASLFKEMRGEYKILKESISNFSDLLKTISSGFNSFSEEFKLDNQIQLKIIDQTKKYMETALMLWDFLFTPHPPFIALWLEIQKNSQNISIHYVNLNNDEFLNKTLYSKKDSIIFTSATLAVNKQVESFKENIKYKNDAQFALLPTTFNYQENCKLLIPSEIAAPVGSDNLSSPYIKDILPFIKDAISSCNGGVLILCTSFVQINLIKEYLTDENLKYPLFIQNSSNFTKLISDFKESKNGVLIGVDSFWEGIDIKGDDLKMVIITKLPFKPPGNPIAQTQQELIESRGENPFMKLSVPEAVIKFKQGFGRLIRSYTDKGVVVCLDSRLISKFYGKIFLESLPITPTILKNNEAIKEIKKFFKF